MTKPRSHYVDAHHARYYHITSRCVRRAWLLGKDPLTGVNHNHRKTVFLRRMHYLARFFAVEVMGYAIMSNHFHLVLHYDPQESQRWSEEEVAWRWCNAFYGKSITEAPSEPLTLDQFDLEQTVRYHSLLLDSERLQKCRSALGSLSRYMQHLKQPFSLWANREEGCKGSFYERRFYSGVLLNEDDLLACMAYVDLNPVEAGMAKTLREADSTSIHERLSDHRFNADALNAFLSPLRQDAQSDVESPEQPQRPPYQLRCTLKTYAEQLTLAVTYLTQSSAEFPSGLTTWMARLLNRKRKSTGQVAAFFDYA